MPLIAFKPDVGMTPNNSGKPDNSTMSGPPDIVANALEYDSSGPSILGRPSSTYHAQRPYSVHFDQIWVEAVQGGNSGV